MIAGRSKLEQEVEAQFCGMVLRSIELHTDGDVLETTSILTALVVYTAQRASDPAAWLEQFKKAITRVADGIEKGSVT